MNDITKHINREIKLKSSSLCIQFSLIIKIEYNITVWTSFIEMAQPN